VSESVSLQADTVATTHRMASNISE
jgi:hypothetical protein